VFADLSAISGSANVWADFAGALGRVEDALTGTPIHGAALKEVIRRGTVVVCHRDNTDPAHPTLKVDGTEAAGQPGTSLTLASLADVDNAAATAPAGKVLGTTGVGEWGPVDPPAAAPALALDDLSDVAAPEPVAPYKALVRGTSGWAPGDVVPAIVSGQTADAWNAATTYHSSSVVSYGGLYWLADRSTTGETPTVGPTSAWSPVAGISLADVAGRGADLGLALITAGGWPVWWESGTGYADTDLVLTQDVQGYQLWAATGPVPAGVVPGTDPTRWRRLSLLDPSPGVWKSWTGTQSAYDALAVKDPATLYVITP
jgi:hypothetical protein